MPQTFSNLFMTPEQVASAERAAVGSNSNDEIRRRAALNFGGSLGGMAIRAGGGDSRSTDQINQAAVLEVMQNVDISTNEGRRAGVVRLQEAGLHDAAGRLQTMVDKLPDALHPLQLEEDEKDRAAKIAAEALKAEAAETRAKAAADAAAIVAANTAAYRKAVLADKAKTQARADKKAVNALADTLERANPDMTRPEAVQQAAATLDVAQKDALAEVQSSVIADADAGTTPKDTPQQVAAKRVSRALRVGLTDAQKKVDGDYGADYNEWTATGRSQADKSLTQLTDALGRLRIADEASEGVTGSFDAISGNIVGNLPNALRSAASLTLQQDIQESAMAGIRAAMGSQFTEKEGERVMANAYDPTLEPEENILKVERTLVELKKRMAAEETRAAHFGRYGTLVGVEGLMDKGGPALDATPEPVTVTPGVAESPEDELARLIAEVAAEEAQP